MIKDKVWKQKECGHLERMNWEDLSLVFPSLGPSAGEGGPG